MLGATAPGIVCGEAMPILPTCVTVPLSLGTNDWLLRLSTSEADEDDGDSPANPRYCHLLLLLMIHNPQVKHREKKKYRILFVRMSPTNSSISNHWK